MKQVAKAWLVVSAMALAACKLGGGEDTSQSAEPAPPPPPADTSQATNEVVRYAGMEAPESGPGYIRQPVAARRAADYVSPIVATLYSGTGVQRVARYGNFTLVQFTTPQGTQQGWVDSGLAWRPIIWDAGTVVPTPTTPVTVTTPPTTTSPPPATTTAKGAPTTPPPPATTTSKGPPPPPLGNPTSTSTSKGGGFKPPPPKGH